MTSLKPLLLLSEVLDVLPIERSTLYRLMNSGKLPSRKLGRLRVVRREDLDAFVENLPAGDIASRRGGAA